MARLTYREVCELCEAEDRKTFDPDIARYYCRKLFKDRGYGARFEDRMEEVIQAAFCRWMTSSGKLSPASCVIFEDKRLTAKEHLYGETFTFSPLALTTAETCSDATARDLVWVDPSLLPTLDTMLGSLPEGDEESRQLFGMLSKGVSKSDIAAEFGISRPTLYRWIESLRCHIDQCLSDHEEQVIETREIVRSETPLAESMSIIMGGPIRQCSDDIANAASAAYLIMCESLVA